MSIMGEYFYGKQTEARVEEKTSNFALAVCHYYCRRIFLFHERHVATRRNKTEDFLWTFEGAELSRYKILSADTTDAAQLVLLAKRNIGD